MLYPASPTSGSLMSTLSCRSATWRFTAACPHLLNPKNKGNLRVREHPLLSLRGGPVQAGGSPYTDIQDLMDLREQGPGVCGWRAHPPSPPHHKCSLELLFWRRLGLGMPVGVPVLSGGPVGPKTTWAHASLQGPPARPVLGTPSHLHGVCSS